MQSVKYFLVAALLCCNFAANAKDGVIYKSSLGHSFVTGGISEEEAAQIRRNAKPFSLHLLFSLGNAGAWITDVSIYILDANGNMMFSKKQAGPLLYIDLPAGDYQIVGKYQDVKQSKRLTLTGEKPKRVILNWKDESEEYETSNKQDVEAE
jgi:hypothetical protein